jgi:hypothetical protein
MQAVFQTAAGVAEVGTNGSASVVISLRGKIRGTLRMRSYVLVLPATTKFSNKSFVFQ